MITEWSNTHRSMHLTQHTNRIGYKEYMIIWTDVETTFKIVKVVKALKKPSAEEQYLNTIKLYMENQ